MKMIMYKCNLCEKMHEEKTIYGFGISGLKFERKRPIDAEFHFCVRCWSMLRDFFNVEEKEIRDKEQDSIDRSV